ncbi:hypothetical protein [Flammeovirga sp. SJP92]|uniref:hypothetical protein n=1 Tax=Flammeovirga sp. SJP92 TaxID=1775430 RepID=UPI000787AF6E|nr:hypothetical protein [Flammeovirga sp. SJP92]KXX69439.1 hypothetical protein AVL50_19375 [Flammeovirga sp. SJP92]
MKNTIIFLFGNRDLQIDNMYKASDITDKGEKIIESYFEIQNDGKERVVKKNLRAEGITFLDISQKVFDAYADMEDAIRFPMVEKTLEYLDAKSNDTKLVFCTSSQEPKHIQDSFYFGEVALKFFKNKGFEAEHSPFSLNPNDFEGLVTYFSELFTKQKSGVGNLYISNSGGTPNMRAASHFAGIFRGYHYLNITGISGEVNVTSFDKQEGLILSQIVDQMLSVYDYEGILQLPVSEVVKEKCREALSYYNLDTDYITQHEKYQDRAIKAIELIYGNLVVCVKQGRYADVIGRIYRLEEAIWQYLFYKKLKEDDLINDSDKVWRVDSKGKGKFDRKFEKTDSDRSCKDSVLESNYPEHFAYQDINGRKQLMFTKFEKLSTGIGKSLYYFLNKSLEINSTVCDFYSNLNNGYDKDLNHFGNLRNKSLLGHGFKGVSKEDIEKITGNISSFMQQQQAIVEEVIDGDVVMIFDNMNAEIYALLK